MKKEAFATEKNWPEQKLDTQATLPRREKKYTECIMHHSQMIHYNFWKKVKVISGDTLTHTVSGLEFFSA